MVVLNLTFFVNHKSNIRQHLLTIMSLSSDDMELQLKIIKEFIRDKVEKTGAEGVVLGLSGGLDSAVVLKLCLEALSPEQVHCLLLPEEATPDIDTEHARKMAEEWGVPFTIIDIGPVIDTFPIEQEYKLPLANLKARVRMCMEYYYANLENKLVVGTSNKSELLLGYTTKYGDSASDFLPIGDIYKSDLGELAEYIGVPSHIIKKVPRAGLWKGQTDEKELGYSYEELDAVLKGIEVNASDQEIAEKTGMKISEVEEIKKMVAKGAHKRKFPTILKLRSRTVGIDWREFSY